MPIPFLLVVSAIAGGVATDVTPLEKVIIMLEDLQTEVVTEGKAEAKTYDKFACFCKDMTKEKTDAIKAGQDEQEALQSAIEELTAKREKLDEKISELEKKIEELTKEMEEAAAERADILAEYQTNTADMKGALTALEGAINALKSSRPSSLAQMRSIIKTVRQATLLADALGVGTPKSIKAVSSLLQQPEVPMEDYSFHSEEIISLLEDLKKDFVSTKNELDAAEVKSVAAHDAFMQEKTSAKKDAELDLDKIKKKKAAVVAEIASKSGELTTVSATLLDDQEYMKELAKTCEEQAKTWDQRSQMRADELSALTEAISIIKGTVSQKTTEKTIRFTQNRVSLGKVLQVANDESAMEAIEEEAEEQAVSFVQLGQPRVLLSALAHSASAPVSGPEQEKRTQVLSLLRSEGKKLKSQVLVSLALQVASDPFVKIRKLIQELIERLLQEAADEANHKGWCDKEMSAAKQARAYNAEEIVELNDRLAINEALRDKLTEEIDILDKEIKELEDELAMRRSCVKTRRQRTLRPSRRQKRVRTQLRWPSEYYPSSTRRPKMPRLSSHSSFLTCPIPALSLEKHIKASSLAQVASLACLTSSCQIL
jgi:predicted  nucleic acid-binding Zn-ribbon protein